MPKRVVDGESLWASGKLLQVEPEARRAEFANLLPLSLANGSFECDPRMIWSRVYSYNRPSVTPEMVVALLDEFERVKMLFRWTAADGKMWGTFVGISKPGRLPSPSDVKKGEKIGAQVPQALLQEFLVAPQGWRGPSEDRAGTGREPGGDSAHGFGFGFGKGSGSGSADAGGAGGGAPASEALETPRAKAPELSSFSEDNSKSNDIPPSSAAQTVVQAPEATPALRPTSNPASTSQVSPVTPTSTPVPTLKKPPAPSQTPAAPSQDPEEPFNALDFAMMREEPFAGHDYKVLSRVVFYHWKIAKPYWSLPQAKVNSPARLEQVLPKMLEQMPPEFKIPGSAMLVLPQSESNCTVCGGQGFIPGPNEAYRGELAYLQANPCSCVTYDPKPWRTWTREVGATASN